MKYTVAFREQEEDFVIYARERTPLLDRIEALLQAERVLVGSRDEEAVCLSLDRLICFLVEGGRVFAVTDDGRFQVRERLYQLEARYGSELVKIHQSCLVRVSRIRRFRTTVGGSLVVTLDGGFEDYVARRQVRMP